MKVFTKIATLALATALVGGVALSGTTAAGAADVAAPKVTGRALITIDAGMGTLISAISPVPPAKFYGTKLGFPVKSVVRDDITLAGGIGFPSAGAELTSPAVSVASSKLKIGSFKFSVPVTPTESVVLEIFQLTHFTKKVKGKTTVWTGEVRLTRSPGSTISAQQVADLFSALSGKVLAPGDKLGRIEITLNTK